MKKASQATSLEAVLDAAGGPKLTPKLIVAVRPP